MHELLRRLVSAGVTLLIDTRHSPCASQLEPAHHYGPRDWHLQPGASGIVSALALRGIDYLWLVELGNPQKTDPSMKVLREHLATDDSRWPVHRGLQILKDTLQRTGPCALLCACADHRICHRTVIAEAAHARFLELAITVDHLV
jgi:hypothetical protein